MYGDGTTTYPGNFALANTAVAAGTYGNGTPYFTGFNVDAKGRLTSASATPLTTSSELTFNLSTYPANFYSLGISANGATNALLAQMPANTIKGNNTSSTANASDLTVAQVNAMIGNSYLGLSPYRLSLTSGVYVHTGDVTGATTLYATPWQYRYRYQASQHHRFMISSHMTTLEP
jgi:hypothetical protein